MSDIRNERHDDATATPTAAASAGSADANAYTQPTVPLPAPDAPLTAPAAEQPQAPLFPAPIISPAAAPMQPQQPQPGYGAQPGFHAPQAQAQPGYGAPAGYGDQPIGMAPMQQAPAVVQQGPAVVPGSHSAHPQFGAGFGESAGRPSAPGAAFGVASTPAPAAPRRSRGGMLAGALALVAIVGVGAGVGGSYLGNQIFNGPVAVGPASGPQTVTINNPDAVGAVTAVSAKVLPSVVTLTVSAGQSGGSGSGVILSADGYVLTNTHVITLGGASADATVRVTTSDGKIYDAKIVGTDPTYDLAVVKLVGASGLTPINWGDSTKLNVGDQTIAVGAPLGLDDTVTSGIVSALNRSISIQSAAVPESQGDQTQQPPQDQQGGSQSPFQFDLPGQTQQAGNAGTISISVIQTDAAINPGNSGGALVNAKGELIGINVAIATAGSSSGSGESGNIGVGFSIPSSVAERVAGEIMKDGKATHGLLGASVGSSTASTAGTTVEGALVRSVVSGGAADAAGLREGDIVTGFNGAPVSNATDLTAQVRALAAGADATLTYNRDGKSFDVKVTLGALTQ